MPAAVSIPVGVIIAREEIDSQWEDHRWRPAGLLPGAPEVPDWTELRRGEGWVHYLAGSSTLELFRKETEAYKFNIEGREPVVYIVLSEDEDGESEFPVGVHLVTASPFEAQDYLDSGEQVVEPVPMPEPVLALVSEFIETHHVEETFKKRQRSEVKLEDHKFGQESLAELRKRMKEESGHE